VNEQAAEYSGMPFADSFVLSWAQEYGEIINMMSVKQNSLKPTQLDESAALAALDGSRELLKRLGQMFCEDAPLLIQALNSALESDNQPAARRAVHSIKGLAATFFAKPTVELAQRLEYEAAEGRLQTLKDGGVEQLDESLRSLGQELKASGWVDSE
jgi:HPt (histidine-containing phosphotransfer) domain-containing protein